MASNMQQSDSSDEENVLQPPRVVGVQPYLFEPRRQAREEPAEPAEPANNPENRLGNTDWCQCCRCLPMTTSMECTCCQEIQQIKEKLEKQDQVTAGLQSWFLRRLRLRCSLFSIQCLHLPSCRLIFCLQSLHMSEIYRPITEMNQSTPLFLLHPLTLPPITYIRNNIIINQAPSSCASGTENKSTSGNFCFMYSTMFHPRLLAYL